MGYGDDLLITKYASEIKKKFPERQVIIGSVKKKQAYHSIIYDNNPNITNCNKLDTKKPIHVIDYHPGNRPYIDYKKSTSEKYFWNNKFKPVPGQIFFSSEENKKADMVISEAVKYWKYKNKHNFKSIIFYEPCSTKKNDKQFGIKQLNKDWGTNNWNNLALKLQNQYLLIQSSHSETNIIEGVYKPENLNFREACAVLNKCNLYVGLEGGFVQAAAALNKKAVVYFGGWIDPKIIGYDFHENIYYNNEKSPCGEYKSLCNHCEDARKVISVDFFYKKISKIF